jgi:hypothetical protein
VQTIDIYWLRSFIQSATTEMPQEDHSSDLRGPYNSKQVKGWRDRLSTTLFTRLSSETHSLAPEETAEDTTEIAQKGEHFSEFLLASGQRSRVLTRL